MEKWRVGNFKTSVVTDSIDGFNKSTGHIEPDYYGGTLICESIFREKDAYLIASAPELRLALEKIVRLHQKGNRKKTPEIESAIEILRKSYNTENHEQ
jgi:hypothetical protein